MKIIKKCLMELYAFVRKKFVCDTGNDEDIKDKIFAVKEKKN